MPVKWSNSWTTETQNNSSILYNSMVYLQDYVIIIIVIVIRCCQTQSFYLTVSFKEGSKLKMKYDK